MIESERVRTQIGASVTLHHEGFINEGFIRLDETFIDEGFIRFDETFIDEGFINEGFINEGFINEGFIRSDEGFIRSGRGALGAKNGVTKSLNSTGFIRVFDMAERHVIYSEKPNAFLMIFGSISRKWPRNDQFSTGFIRYFEQLFCMC